ncbi:PREDICTED: uncharacterized protein K02A2.6-like [Priapulus caudatus]|uniref:Uncharacterized protein K02A2.6-like n=1 Tax=Priapulus caudatus TaxID=37621 RepID=A0ABM1E7Z5_PRICU|nr:PREDICTED: uncharacterized protein K02A2.6-like [Priapulus caudatus]
MIGSDLFVWNQAHYLIVVDYYSSFPIVRKLSTVTSAGVIQSLRGILAEYGIPETIISDNRPQYSSSEFAKFAEEYGFKHVTSSPNYPQANGKAERYVGVIKKKLEKARESGQNPALALLCIRTTPLSARLPSPAELLFNRKIQSNFLMVNMTANDEEVQEGMRDKQDRSQARYDAHTKPLPELQAGQSARIQHPVTKRWEPARNECTELPRSYVVEAETGARYRRDRKQIRQTGENFNFERELETDGHNKIETPVSVTSVPHATLNSSNSDNTYVTRSGRAAKAQVRLNL